MGRKKKDELQTAGEAQIQGDKTSSPQSELKAKIESILFCIPDGVTVDLLAHKVNMASTEAVQWALEELKKEHENKTGPKIVFEDRVWKFKVPDEHISVIQDAAQPELDRAVIETLAYIAWRNGSRQCDVVRVRGNKAYNHIKLLKEKEFIVSHKSGLSKWLEPTKKFYEYFNLKQGDKLPVSEEVRKAAEEAEKATAAVQLQQQEQEAQQAHIVEQIKENVETKKKSKDKKESEEDEEPDDKDKKPDSGEEPNGDIEPDEEPPESDEEEPEENKSNKGNPDNE